MLFFPSLSQIPSSPLPLPISCFSSSIYVSPSLTFPLPVHPHTTQRDHVAHLALSLQKSFPIQPCTFPSSFSSTLLVLLFLPYFFFPHLLSVPSAFTCFQAYLRLFCLTGMCPLPSPTFTRRRRGLRPALAVGVLSQVSPGADPTSPRGAGQTR